jgi:hypothetical protein
MIADLIFKIEKSPYNALGQKRARNCLFPKVSHGKSIEKLLESVFYVPLSVLFKKGTQTGFSLEVV